MTRSRVDPEGHSRFVWFVAGHDVPCPGCGYNLRDLKEPSCPECGRALVVGVHFAEPRLAWFIAALLGAAGGAGFALVVLVYYLVDALLGGHTSWFGYSAILMSVLSCGCAIAALVRFRRRIERRSKRVRIGAVGISWVVGIVAVLWYFWAFSL